VKKDFLKGGAMFSRLFVNLPVQDLERSMAFFRRLNFRFDACLNEARAACMAVSKNVYIVLLGKGNTRLPLRAEGGPPARMDANSQVIVTLPVESRAEVDDLVERALAAGGTPASGTLDFDCLYGRSFFDPDGNVWEIQWLSSPSAAESSTQS